MPTHSEQVLFYISLPKGQRSWRDDSPLVKITETAEHFGATETSSSVMPSGTTGFGWGKMDAFIPTTKCQTKSTQVGTLTERSKAKATAAHEKRERLTRRVFRVFCGGSDHRQRGEENHTGLNSQQ